MNHRLLIIFVWLSFGCGLPHRPYAYYLSVSAEKVVIVWGDSGRYENRLGPFDKIASTLYDIECVTRTAGLISRRCGSSCKEALILPMQASAVPVEVKHYRQVDCEQGLIHCVQDTLPGARVAVFNFKKEVLQSMEMNKEKLFNATLVEDAFRDFRYVRGKVRLYFRNRLYNRNIHKDYNDSIELAIRNF